MCASEVNDASQVVDDALTQTDAAYGNLSNASEYGIQPYNELQAAINGSGLQAHHIIEQRFSAAINMFSSKMPSVALTPEEHQIFTNAWRNLIGYSNSTNVINTINATKEQIWAAAQTIYSNYPELLEAARIVINGPVMGAK